METGESKSAPKEVFITKVVMASKSETKTDTVLSSSESDSDTDSDAEFECKVCDKRFSGYKPFLQHELSGKHRKALLKKEKAKALRKKIAVAEQLSEDEEGLLQMEDSFASCEVCKKEFGSPESYLAHLNSKVHKQKVRQASILEQVTEDGEINLEKLKKVTGKDSESEESDGGGEQSLSLECSECEKSFSSVKNFAQHMFSKVHAKTVQKKKLAASLVQKGNIESASPAKYDVSTLAEEDGILVCKLCTVTFSGPENAMAHLKSRGHRKNLEKLAWKRQLRQARRSLEAKSESEASIEESGDSVSEVKKKAGAEGDAVPISVSDAESSGKETGKDSITSGRSGSTRTSTALQSKRNKESSSAKKQPNQGQRDETDRNGKFDFPNQSKEDIEAIESIDYVPCPNSQLADPTEAEIADSKEKKPGYDEASKLFAIYKEKLKDLR